MTAPLRPNYRGASGGNVLLQRALENFETRVVGLQTKAGLLSFDSQKQSPAMAPPPHASVEVSAVPSSGRFVVRITNPEYVNRGNQYKTPILHFLQFSPNQNFSSGVVEFPISTQTYYSVPVEDVGGTPGNPFSGYFQWRSSYDGEHFNQPIRSPNVTA